MFLYRRTPDSGYGTDSEHQSRTWCFSNYLGFLQRFRNHRFQFWRHDTPVVLSVCADRNFSASKTKTPGKICTDPGSFTDPAEYCIHPIFKSFLQSAPGIFPGNQPYTSSMAPSFSGSVSSPDSNRNGCCHVLLSITVSLIFSGRLHGVGIGTLLAVIGAGRVIALFNHFTKDFLLKAAGLTE